MKRVLLGLLALGVINFVACFDDAANGSSQNDLALEINKAVTAANEITVYYKANAQWMSGTGAINLHYNKNNAGWTSVPGVAMVKHTLSSDSLVGYASYTVSDAASLVFCFNYSGSTWDNNGGVNYTISAPGTYKVENGTITAVTTKATGDVYMTGVYPEYQLAGLPVSLYKDGVVVSTSAVTYTTSHGTYATFNDLPEGSYIAVLDSYTKDNWNAPVLFSGKTASFTVALGATYFTSQTIQVTADYTQSEIDIYFSTTYSSYALSGAPASIYRNGVLFSAANINVTATHGTYATFKNLPAGEYRAVLNYTADSTVYTGETTFTVTSGDTYELSKTINVNQSVDGITVYYKANVQWISSPSTINAHYNKNNAGWTAVPGVAMEKHTGAYDAWVGYASIAIAGASSLKVCFNKDGIEWDNNGGSDYTISAKGVYKIENGQVTKVN